MKVASSMQAAVEGLTTQQVWVIDVLCTGDENG